MNRILNIGSKMLATACIAIVALVSTANAHFQLIYSPGMALEHGGKVRLKMPFTHPAISGPVMDMTRPVSFDMLHKGEKKSLTDLLTQISWTSAENTGIAWEAEVQLKGLGDYVFTLVPEPYFDTHEDIYIQQLTKTILNIGGVPTDWNDTTNLAAEIRPLNKPYANYVGGTFTGVVMSMGKAVPFAEIEVEFMNFPPSGEENKFREIPLIITPTAAFETQTIISDANGTFTFGLPKAGYWGFAALDVGPEKTFKGKPLSQDAVIWVQATVINH